MVSVWQILALIGGGALLAVLCVLAGAWIMFKGKAGPGEGFISTPKGELFTIPEAGEAPAFPGAEQSPEEVRKQTERFLGLFGGNP